MPDATQNPCSIQLTGQGSTGMDPQEVVGVLPRDGGGEEGARNGPSLMPGGKRVAFDLMAPILIKCAAQVDDGACTGYLGPIGAGNYVKVRFWSYKCQIERT